MPKKKEYLDYDDEELLYLISDNNDETKEIIIPEKADQQYAFEASIIYHLWRGKDEVDERNRLNGFFRIIKKLPSNFSTMAMIDAMSFDSAHKKINKDYTSILLSHPSYKDWAKIHGKSMRKHI